MATITFNNTYGNDMNALFNTTDRHTVLATASSWVIGDFRYGGYAEQVWTGSHLSYNGAGWIKGGTATKVEFLGSDGDSFALINLSAPWNFTANGFPTVWALLSGADVITGGRGDDILVAGSGNNTVNGGAGDDTIDYRLETGDSIVNLALGTATIAAQGSNPAHTDKLNSLENIWAGSGNDKLIGNSRSNWLEGGAGNDKIYGGAGNDYISGGIGVNTLDGGIGTDTLSFVDLPVSGIGLSVNANLATGNVSVAAVNAGTVINFETVIGSNGNDVLTGNALDNELVGGFGVDTMEGGAGNDIYRVDNTLDVVKDLGNDSKDEVFTQGITSYTLGIGIENLTLSWLSYGIYFYGSGAVANGYANTLHLTGNALDNTLTLNSNSDFYFPQPALTPAGAVISTSGAVITAGEVVISTGGGDIKIITPPIITPPVFTQKPVYGTAYLDGGAGNDILVGSNGNDILNGGSGNDTMQGGLGTDTFIIDSSNDVISADDGGDTVISAISLNLLPDTIEVASLMNVSTALNLNGNSSDNRLKGNNFNNTLNGNDGNDTLYGNAGNDRLNGGLGNDWLQGGAGNDRLNGGGGFDTADYSLSSGKVVVNLSLTAAQNTGFAGLDTLASIEGINAGEGNDRLTGNNLANTLWGNDGNDTLNGGGGSDRLYGDYDNDVLNGGVGNDDLQGGGGDDILDGGAGSDTLLGDKGKDTFVLANKDNTTDYFQFFSASDDKIRLQQSGLGNIGDGDTLVEGGVIKTASGGFSKSAELVIFKSPISHDIYDVGAVIGSASSAYTVGDQRIFIVKNDVLAIDMDNAHYADAGVYLFTSANTDALVSNSELKLLAQVLIDDTMALSVGNFFLA